MSTRYTLYRFIRFQGLLGSQIFFSLWYLNRKISVVSLAEIIKKSLPYIHNNGVNKFDKLNEIILVFYNILLINNNYYVKQRYKYFTSTKRQMTFLYIAIKEYCFHRYL